MSSSPLDLNGLPDGWHTVPLFSVAAETKVKNVGLRENNLLSLSYGRIIEKDIQSSFGLLPESFEGYHIVKPGDIVLRLTDLQNDQKSLRTGLVEDHGIITSAYVTLRPFGLYPQYLSYLLHAYDVGKAFYALGGGLRQGMTFADLKNLNIPKPPVYTQRTIANFLDDQVVQIDRMIELRRKQLSLLTERHMTAVAHEVLLSASAEAADVEFAWTTKVGSNRAVVPLRSLVQQRGEKNDPIVTEQILSLTAARGVIKYEDKGDIGNKASEDPSRYSVVHPGDLVVNSMNVIIGSVGLSKYYGALSPVYYVLKPRDETRVHMPFLAHYFSLEPFQKQLIRIGYGILDHRMRIPWINLGSEPIAIPDLPLQIEIAERVDTMSKDMERSRELILRSIDLLQERKRSLITAAVTGQFDVSTASNRASGTILEQVAGTGDTA